MDDYKNTCKKIWEGYKTYAFTAAVIRKGYETFGVSVASNDSLHLSSTFYRRSESVLEHQAKTAWLASVFTSNFPDYFGNLPVSDLDPINWSIMVTALCHDVGETRIGDILDDGNPLHETKDVIELEEFERFVNAYDYKDQARLINLFETFQNKNSIPGRALYALDKTEAVLTHLLLEKHGTKGDLSKKENPTGRDLFFAEAIGETTAADIWGAQMFLRIRDYPLNIIEPIKALLKVASYDVRGKEFSWIRERTP